jgi:poly(3-hydroxybutyrate) depolymerase
MHSIGSMVAPARTTWGAAAVLFGVLLGGCSENNEGNVTTPPPPTTYMTSSGGSTATAGTSSTGGGSVIPVGGGSASDVNQPWPSTGCGQKLAEPVTTIPDSRTGYVEYHVTQTGATLGTDEPSKAGDRQFFVRVPFDYDENRPYRVVYIGQGCGAQHAGKTNTYALFSETQGGTEQAIYVGVSVPDNAANPGCYDNNSGVQSQEWEAFDLMHTLVEKTYCVDNNRIYVSGYSTGGWLANMWGCYFGGTPSPPLDQPDVDAGRTERKFAPSWAIRGHANVTGSLPPNQPVPCNGPSAGFWLHDALDKSNLIETNIKALELQLKTNGCTGNYKEGPKQAWAPAENIMGLQGGICQEYTGCDPEVAKKYPLIFCTTSGLGHADQASSAIPAFTTFFNLMDPKP